jgi:integrase
MSSGHIQRRGPNSWRIKFDIDVDSNTGKRRTRYYTVKGTKRQAQAELTKLLASANAGTYVDPANTTVPEFLERWLRDWGSVNVSPSTLQRYAGIVHKQIIPQVGKIKIQKLQADKIAEMYATLLREGRCKKTEDASTSGLSPRTVGHVHRVLHRALDIAAKWGVVARRPPTFVCSNVRSIFMVPAVRSTSCQRSASISPRRIPVPRPVTAIA